MASPMADIAFGTLKLFVKIYDIITFPLYYIIQRPWEVVNASEAVLAEPISADSEQITYKNSSPLAGFQVIIKNENLQTMDQLIKRSVNCYRNKPFLGTRQIFSEEDELQPNGRVFKKYQMGDYKYLTFGEAGEQIRKIGLGLRELGVKPRDNIVLFAETRAEWLLTCFACFQQSITVVTVYATLGEEGVKHAINETEVECVVTSFDLLPKVKKIAQQLPRVKKIVYMEDPLKKELASGDENTYSFRELVKLGESSKLVPAPPTKDDVGVIMYTSGSTGTPKGVVMKHSNIVACMLAYGRLLEIQDSDVYIAYLPLAHVLELLAESLCMVMGITLGYSSPLTLTDKSSKVKKGCKGDASVLQPTIMASVPLILDRIYKAIMDKMDGSKPFLRNLCKFCVDYKVSWQEKGYNTPLVDKLIFSRMSGLLGGRVRVICTGGAPLSPDSHRFLRTVMCCPIIQGYGLTETCGAASAMTVEDLSVGRVGPPLNCCDIKLVNWSEGNYLVTDKPYPRGEVVVGGDNVADSYYKNPEKTKEDFLWADGKMWFKTGDIAEVHPDGHMKLIDRKKDLVKLQFGEYLSLGKVESELKTCPLVDNVCVYADPLKTFAVAIVVPDRHHLFLLGQKFGKDLSFDELCSDPEVQKTVLKELKTYGLKAGLEKFEVPEAIMLCKDAWTPDMGLVTAAFKLKRKDIQIQYQEDIDRLYRQHAS